VGHDDLADALYIAAGPYQDSRGEWRSRLGDAVEGTPEPRGLVSGETVATGAGLCLPRRPVWAPTGLPGRRGRVRTISYRPVDPTHGAMRGGDLTLRGEHHFDRGAGGVLVVPEGFTEIRSSEMEQW